MASGTSYVVAMSHYQCTFQITNVYEKDISTANNTSVLHIDFNVIANCGTWTFGGSTRSNAGYVGIRVDGNRIGGATVPIPNGMYDGEEIASGSVETTIAHNDDGSKSVSYGITMDAGTDDRGANYYWADASWSDDSITLTTITRNWTVSYVGNGGTTPASQNKHYGIAINLGSSSRDGYTFQYWQGSDGSNYGAGASFNGNYDLTLTAIWSINTWPVSFNANGGSGAPGNQTKTYGQTLTISSTVPTRTLYDFVSWSGSDGNTYYPGGSFTGNYAISLTANWKLAYVAPSIKSLNAYHCAADGTASDSGPYIKVIISWSIDTTVYPDNTASGIKVTCEGTDVGTISISGTSGTSELVFGGSYNYDASQTVSVYVYDVKQPSLGTSKSTLAQGAKYAIDIDPTNNHICFGGSAESQYAICVKENGVITWHP
jgi:hypothetical protein